jgi:hypothetical protein
MVDTSLEIECRNCNERFWYEGDKTYPEIVECLNCNRMSKIPEDG